MRLEDFVFFNKVSNFVCGLGENCLAGQVSLSKAKKKKKKKNKERAKNVNNHLKTNKIKVPPHDTFADALFCAIWTMIAWSTHRLTSNAARFNPSCGSYSMRYKSGIFTSTRFMKLSLQPSHKFGVRGMIPLEFFFPS